MSSAYHPQLNGQMERLNRCLENYLRCMTFQHPHKWCSWLLLAEWWYNSSYHSNIKMSPFQGLYGYPHPIFNFEDMNEVTVAKVEDFLLRKQDLTVALKENLITAQNRMKQLVDLKRSERMFQVGDWVFLKLQPINRCQWGVGRVSSFLQSFMGHFSFCRKWDQ